MHKIKTHTGTSFLSGKGFRSSMAPVPLYRKKVPPAIANGTVSDLSFCAFNIKNRDKVKDSGNHSQKPEL